MPKPMLIIEIPTDNPDLHDAEHAGTPLAALLRKVADGIEQEVNIVPWPGGEWITETRREAGRFDGILLGATITLAGSDQS